MSVHAYPTLLEKLRDKDYRRAFTSASVRNFIALQIRTLRKLTFSRQAALAEAAGTTASVISRLEDPNYGKATISTLLDLAGAFDVALIVRFATFGELAKQIEDLSNTALVVPSFRDELEKEDFNRALTTAFLSNVVQIEDTHVSGGSAADFTDHDQRKLLGSMPVIQQTPSGRTMGVGSKVADRARQVMLRSAKQAGFMDLQPDRLTLPAIRDMANGEPKKDTPPEQKTGGGTGGGGTGHHPFIDGLIQTLPKASSTWGTKERMNWLVTANSVFKMIYQSDDSDDITIDLKKGKATDDLA